jgi:hypothetical protein
VGQLYRRGRAELKSDSDDSERGVTENINRHLPLETVD